MNPPRDSSGCALVHPGDSEDIRQVDVAVHVGEQLVPFAIVDTGSGLTMMSRRTYEGLVPRPPLQVWENPVPLYGVGGGK